MFKTDPHVSRMSRTKNYFAVFIYTVHKVLGFNVSSTNTSTWPNKQIRMHTELIHSNKINLKITLGFIDQVGV